MPKKKPQKKPHIIPRVVPSPGIIAGPRTGYGRTRSAMWEYAEWDLAEAGRILDTESIVRQVFEKKRSLFLKEGYDFVSKNPERSKYIRSRFEQMEFATGVPFPTLFSQTIWSLIRQNNAFWVKARKASASGGRIRRNQNGREIQPIAGYFLLPAETIRFKRDKSGKILKYKQDVPGKEAKEFSPENIVHFYWDKREGFAVGTPSLVPVKDDIRALRRIEENVEMLVYQHLFPLFHYKVGTEKLPAQTYPDGGNELDEVVAEVAAMPTDGCWVTPERHSIEVLGASGKALAVEKIIAHFKQRIYTGLGVSSVDMGEADTSNKSTADTMSRNLIDATKAYQKEFGSLFYAYVIKELLLESGFDPFTLFDEENKVVLKFAEIDFESRMKRENHYTDIYLKNAITHSEMRNKMGEEAFSEEDWKDTNWARIEREKIVLQALDEPGTPESKSVAKAAANKSTKQAPQSLNTRKSAAAGGNSVANKNKPRNQHGERRSAKIKKDSMSVERRALLPLSLGSIFRQHLPLQRYYSILRQDLVDYIRKNGWNEEAVESNINLAFEMGKKRLVSLSQRAYRNGLADVGVDPWSRPSAKADRTIENHIKRFSEKLRNELLGNLKRNAIGDIELKAEDAVFVSLAMDAMYHRTEMIDESEIMRAYNYGRAHGLRLQDVEIIESSRIGSDPCEICDGPPLRYYRSDAIIYEGLAPRHPHCICLMVANQ